MIVVYASVLLMSMREYFKDRQKGAHTWLSLLIWVSLLIGSAMAMAVGASPWEAAYIGSVAAAVQVSRAGNLPIKTSDLAREISG